MAVLQRKPQSVSIMSRSRALTRASFTRAHGLRKRGRLSSFRWNNATGSPSTNFYQDSCPSLNGGTILSIVRKKEKLLHIRERREESQRIFQHHFEHTFKNIQRHILGSPPGSELSRTAPFWPR